jgi:hypothetical protein
MFQQLVNDLQSDVPCSQTCFEGSFACYSCDTRIPIVEGQPTIAVSLSPWRLLPSWGRPLAKPPLNR